MADAPRYVPFNRPLATGAEEGYIREAIANGHLSSGGPFARRCAAWLERETGCARALLTHSGTGALEMAALLAGIEPGDEVIMPSFTYVTTANAFVLRGGVPVFVDIRPDTLNLDERLVEDAVTDRTRAVVPVHYAGVACEMDAIREVADRHGLLVIEDAAHALTGRYRDRPLGSIGDLGTISFHETKNLTCGEGGALLVRDAERVERAEIVHEKGTDRSRFLRGQVDKYSWVDVGSSFSPSEISAAFLWAQLEAAESVTERRLRLWQAYHAAFAGLEEEGRVRRPVVPAHCSHDGHLYYLLLPGGRDERDRLIEELERRGVNAVFHYVPLHSSAAGRRHGRAVGDLEVTRRTSDGLVRLPLWAGMTDDDLAHVVDAVHEALGSPASPGPWLARSGGR
jgi:dTDP-4-amino-4,6-dideoxygalactose transaminase